jgi:hypothetical protein
MHGVRVVKTGEVSQIAPERPEVSEMPSLRFGSTGLE